jgi:ATPase subunit of ABC transporter with duplicated ATPase domains
MGRLNLGGEKPLQKIGELSGGRKACVALSMFALKASNLLMLDEPSNHLDVGCIDALATALSKWGGEDGAIVVISRDQSFCDKVGFTHVGTVMNGGLTRDHCEIVTGSSMISEQPIISLNKADCLAVFHGNYDIVSRYIVTLLPVTST